MKLEECHHDPFAALSLTLTFDSPNNHKHQNNFVHDVVVDTHSDVSADLPALRLELLSKIV